MNFIYYSITVVRTAHSKPRWDLVAVEMANSRDYVEDPVVTGTD